MREWYFWPAQGTSFPVRECVAAWIVALTLIAAMAAHSLLNG